MEKKNKLLTLDLGKMPDSFDPVAEMTYSGWHVLTNIGGTLFSLNQDHHLSSQLAESWKRSEKDSACYEITLHEGVTFHDGTPLKASDVEFSLKRIVQLDPSSETAVQLDTEKTKALDDRKLHLCSKKPNDYFLYTFALPQTAIVSAKHIYEDKKGFKVKVPVFAGPYKLEQYGDEELDLVLHETHPYAKKKVKAPKKIKIYYTKEGSSLISTRPHKRIKEGVTNFIFDVSGNFSSSLNEAEKKKFNILTLNPNYATFIYFNNVANSELKYKEVRNALAALFYDWNDDWIHMTLSTPANQLIPPGFLGRIDNPPVHRMEQYKAVYERLRKKSVSLRLYSGKSEDPELLKKRKKFMSFAKDFGFNIELSSIPHDEVYKDIKEQNGKIHMAIYKLPFLASDPMTVYRMDFDKKHLPLYDKTGEIYKIIEESKQTTKKDELMALAKNLSRKILEDSLIIPLAYTSVTYWGTKDFNLSKMNRSVVGLHLWEIEQNATGTN